MFLLLLGEQQLQLQLRWLNWRVMATLDLPRRPRIPARFTLLRVSNDEAWLSGASQSFSIRTGTSGLLDRLLPLLDGAHEVEDIATCLQPGSAEDVREILAQFVAAGALEDASQPAWNPLSPAEQDRYREQLIFFSHFTSPAAAPLVSCPQAPGSAEEYQARLKQARVLLIGLGRLGSCVARSLALLGVGHLIGLDSAAVTDAEVHSDAWFEAEHLGRTRSEALRSLLAAANPATEYRPLDQPVATAEALAGVVEQSTFVVMSADEANTQQYEALNLACLRAGTPWTSCRTTPFEFSLGPTVFPGQTSCYHCFDLRQQSNLSDYEAYLLQEAHTAHSAAHGTLLITTGAGLVALEVVKALTQFVEPATCGHLFTLNLLTLQSRLHPILKIPRCTQCGRPAQPRPTIQLWQKANSNTRVDMTS